jgi:hypothetical protein
MTGLVKKLLIGASVVVGFNTVATLPSFAASLDKESIKFYGNIDVFGPGTAEDALTDDSFLTNVELSASTEDLSDSVSGFSGKLGNTEVSVESVTAADWDEFGDQWLDDFEAAYGDLFNANIFGYDVGQMIASEVQKGLTRSGDPNIGSFVQDDATGEYQLGLIGHYNLLQSDSLTQELNQLTGSSVITGIVKDQVSGFLGGNPLQVSEVAKVTIGDQVNYAYSFSATDTGYRDTDGSSHSGLYSWTFQGEPVQSVPEPSTMLGLMAVGGLATLSRRKSRNKA